jgi:hypothetical protein
MWAIEFTFCKANDMTFSSVLPSLPFVFFPKELSDNATSQHGECYYKSALDEPDVAQRWDIWCLQTDHSWKSWILMER